MALFWQKCVFELRGPRKKGVSAEGCARRCLSVSFKTKKNSFFGRLSVEYGVIILLELTGDEYYNVL